MKHYSRQSCRQVLILSPTLTKKKKGGGYLLHFPLASDLFYTEENKAVIPSIFLAEFLEEETALNHPRPGNGNLWL